jgi:hypothetical protein
VGPPTTRPWKQGDDPLKTALESSSAAGSTAFTLESRTMTLTVDGSMTAIHDLLDRLEKERTLSHPHRVQLQGAATSGETVTLELELWLFALSRGKA